MALPDSWTGPETLAGGDIRFRLGGGQGEIGRGQRNIPGQAHEEVRVLVLVAADRPVVLVPGEVRLDVRHVRGRVVGVADLIAGGREGGRPDEGEVRGGAGDFARIGVDRAQIDHVLGRIEVADESLRTVAWGIADREELEDVRASPADHVLRAGSADEHGLVGA